MLHRADSWHPLFGVVCALAICLVVASRARGITLMRHKAKSGGRAAGKAHTSAVGALGAELGAEDAAAAAAASTKGLSSRRPLSHLSTRASWRKASRIKSLLRLS